MHVPHETVKQCRRTIHASSGKDVFPGWWIPPNVHHQTGQTGRQGLLRGVWGPTTFSL